MVGKKKQLCQKEHICFYVFIGNQSSIVFLVIDGFYGFMHNHNYSIFGGQWN
jgi:hypothetical protein